MRADTEVEDTGGGGDLVVTPWFRWEAGHEWGLGHANHRNVLTVLWVQAAVDGGYAPNFPLFTLIDVAMVHLRWGFCRLLRHGIRNKGEGEASRYTEGGGGGHKHGTPSGENPFSPSPNQLVLWT